MVKVFIILFLCVSSFVFVPKVFAEGSAGCDNRYLTLVNPVRSRSFWGDESLKPIQDQYKLVREKNLAATWLVQYDVLSDQELVSEIKNFDQKQEVGVFLEVSKVFGDDSRVIYPYDAEWYKPRAIFLSGYSQSERRRLIDNLFERFRSEFNYYPKSVGAWWIDSYSLNYLKEKYAIKAAMIVADQRITDNYGVWGQWWGVPYYPSKANVLTPASDLGNKQDVVMVQWAQRDPSLAYGSDSSFSLQANDYTLLGQNTDYFKKLVNLYLDCANQLGQVTVGLETGMESSRFLPEYENQLEALAQIGNLKGVTMSEFADRYSKVYPTFPKKVTLSYGDSVWELTTGTRSNNKLGDFIQYDQNRSFKDYFLVDKSNFLDRRLVGGSAGKVKDSCLPWFVVASLVLAVFSYRKKILRVWAISLLISVAALGLILRSNDQYGWVVYYGAVVPKLVLVQIAIIVVPFLIVWPLDKSNRFKIFEKINFTLLFPLSFGLDELLKVSRYSLIENRFYFGFMLDPLRFIGIAFSKPLGFIFVNKDFPAYQAVALLKFDFAKIWDNLAFTFVLYPLVHILVAILLGIFVYRFPVKMRIIIFCLLGVLLALYINGVLQADPRVITPFG